MVDFVGAPDFVQGLPKWEDTIPPFCFAYTLFGEHFQENHYTAL